MSCGIRFGILLLISVVVATPGAVIATTIIYVDGDATGANDGTSWANAYKYLQDALADANAAPKPVEIRVAQGTYRPDEDTLHPDGTGDRTAAFQLINSVILKGGYAGLGGPNPDTRDVSQHETILSGDLDQDDVEVANLSDLFVEPSRTDNSHSVVLGNGTDETALLDGFTVAGGNANDEASSDIADSWGGGIYIDSGSPTILRCTFRRNSASAGGAICNYNESSPLIGECLFEENWAHDGGAMINFISNPSVVHSIFSRNSDLSCEMGGAVYNLASDATFAACRFSENTVAEFGGAMFNDTSGTILIIGCVFADNYARDGGGIMSWYANSETIMDCLFERNSAADSGGGVVSASAGAATLTGCAFLDNVANLPGAGLQVALGHAIVANCTFAGNRASSPGGAVSMWYGSTATFTSCTFTTNSAPFGRAIGCDGYTHAPNRISISNCILWNGGDEISNRDGSFISIKYCNVQNSWPGEGNINADPCFADPGRWDPNGTPEDLNDDFWVDGDYHLLPDSPCINAGDPGFVAGPNETDIDGEARVMLGRVDMGADEFNPFVAGFVVVRKERVGRTVFEYKCELVLENISSFALSGVALEMAQWSENMTIIEPNVSFDDVQVGPGESITSVDTCTFTVDRSEAIAPAEIIWHVAAELADTGEKMEHTVSTALPPDPQTGFDGLKDLAEKWLWQGTAGGIDADSVADGTVNLADFAEFAEQWKKK